MLDSLALKVKFSALAVALKVKSLALVLALYPGSCSHRCLVAGGRQRQSHVRLLSLYTSMTELLRTSSRSGCRSCEYSPGCHARSPWSETGGVSSGTRISLNRWRPRSSPGPISTNSTRLQSKYHSSKFVVHSSSFIVKSAYNNTDHQRFTRIRIGLT